HRHEVGREDDPEEQVAVLRPARDIRREVARIDVRDGRDERGSEERPEATHAPLLASERRFGRAEGRRLAGKNVGDPGFATPKRLGDLGDDPLHLSHSKFNFRCVKKSTADSYLVSPATPRSGDTRRAPVTDSRKSADRIFRPDNLRL